MPRRRNRPRRGKNSDDSDLTNIHSLSNWRDGMTASALLSPRKETVSDATEAQEKTPFISVVVPVRNEAAYIESTLRQLLTQDYDPTRFEVIVADGESSDCTCEIVRRLQGSFPHLILVNNPKRWSSAGRNCGILASQGDLIVVVDGHCQLPGESYLADLAQAFASSGADCLGRPQPLNVRGASSLQRAIGAARAC